jgi:acetyltransferase-like isoleucine patch superfamily enzyme
MFKLLHRLIRRIRKSPTILNTNVDASNFIGPRTVLINSVIGRYSFCGANCSFVETKIGDFCSIGNGVKVIAAQHPINYLSSHPFFYQNRYGNFSKVAYEDYRYVGKSKWQAIIQHDVWIGDDVKILGGVTISTGAVVGTGAVVTKDVPPYAIVVGVPARIIKYRFDNNTIERLLISEWWELPEEQLQLLATVANDPNKFLQAIRR